MPVFVSRYVTFVLGFCVALGIGSGRLVSENVPHDKVIHPLLKGVSDPKLIPESRVDPVYPERWRKLHLGAKVILQGVVKKTGSVGRITILRTVLRVEEDCGKEFGGAEGNRRADQEMLEPGASIEKAPGKQAAPPKAAHDFEVAAVKAVNKWRYRPGEMSGVPVDVYYTMIVEFTPCPQDPEREAP